MGAKLDSHPTCERLKLHLCPPACTQINLKQTKNPNAMTHTETSRENAGKTLKTWEIIPRTEKRDCMESEGFYTAKETTTRVKTQATAWEKKSPVKCLLL